MCSDESNSDNLHLQESLSNLWDYPDVSPHFFLYNLFVDYKMQQADYHGRARPRCRGIHALTHLRAVQRVSMAMAGRVPRWRGCRCTAETFGFLIDFTWSEN